MSTTRFLILLAGCLTGCAQADPYRRQGMWQPEGANAANIAAMVQRPADLLHGRADATWQTHRAADAVDRLWTDRERSFPGHGTTNLGASAGAAGSSSKAGG